MRINDVCVVRADAAERSVVERLLRDYLREVFGTRAEVVAGPTYRYLDLYWTEPGRTAWLINAAGQVAGFALVNDWAPSGLPVDHAMAEFSVAREYRRAEVGTRAAATIIGGLPGQWEIGMQAANAPAKAFWSHVVCRLSRAIPQWLEGDGARWTGPIVRFRSEA